LLNAIAGSALDRVPFLNIMLLGNSVRMWLIALVVSLVALVLLRILRRVLTVRVEAFAKRTETVLDDYVARIFTTTKVFFLFALSAYAGTQVLSLPVVAVKWIGTVTIVSVLVQVGIWGDALINMWLTRYQESNLEVDPGRVTTMRATTFVVRVALFSVVTLVALDNIPGVHVTTLIASMGVGGIAVALATQNILADLFASLSISLDQPFVMGDFIIVDDKMGTVEHVGLKTTRLRSLTGEQLIFANNDLLKSRIRNYKRMNERRILFAVGVTYQTPADKLEAIPAMIKDIVDAQDNVRFDRAHFKGFGDFSLNFEVVYWVKVPDYNVYMDIQQAINLALYRKFGDEGIEFAYPTQTLFLEKESGAGA
jgi:small-conductance mechanosensitive channel